MSLMKIIGFITGMMIGYVVPGLIAWYVLQILQVTDAVVWCALFVFIFLLVSALIKWSLDTILNYDEEVYN